MSDNTSLIQKIGPGKLALLACLALFFIFQPGVFHYAMVVTLFCFPIYFLINKWLDKQL